MKIRTDFVTNSSSSNYVTISIKSPKLTEILRGAKVCKETGEADDGEWDGDRLDIDESEQIVKLRIGMRKPRDEDMVRMADRDLVEFTGCPPQHISGLPESLIRLLKEVSGYHQFRGYDFAKACSALEENGEDILADTKSADWTYAAEGYGEANLDTWFWILSKSIAKKENLDYRPSSARLLCSFHYDRENGESLKREYSYSKPYEEDVTEEEE